MNVTCLKCGWVYFSLTRVEAEREVASFNTYFDGLSREQQVSNYGGITFVDGVAVYGEPRKSSIDHYERCNCGNRYTNFRESREGDCPSGCTINPILHFKETTW